MRVMSVPSSAYSVIRPLSMRPMKDQPRSDFVFLFNRKGATSTREHVAPHPLPDAGETGVIGQLLVQRVAQIPAVGQVEAGRRDELPFRADALEEHHQVQLEKDDRVDGGTAPIRIEILRPLANEAQIKLGLQVTVEVVGRDEGFERYGDRLVKAAGLERPEHGVLW